MSMSKKPAALAAVILATAASGARAEAAIDGTSNTIMVSELAPATERVLAPGLPWMRYDVLARLQGPQPLIGVSHSAAALAVHSGNGGAAPVTTSLFFAGAGAAGNAPFTLRVAFQGDMVAQAELLKTLILAGHPVCSFAEVSMDLEDVFLGIMQGAVAEEAA